MGSLIHLPATGPPAAAVKAYSRLLIQKAAVLRFLSTQVNKMKFWVVTNTPSLNPKVALKIIIFQYSFAIGSIDVARAAVTKHA